MRMRAGFGTMALLALVACDDSPPSSPPEPEVPEQPERPRERTGEREAAPGGTDPLLAKVCAAYDEVEAEGVDEGVVLQTTALRAVRDHGVTEGQLAELGAHPADVLESIRERRSPSACDGFVEALERAQDREQGR